MNYRLYRFVSNCYFSSCTFFVRWLTHFIVNKYRYYNMAILKPKFQNMLRILRILGTFTNTWPPNPNVGRNELFLREIYYYIAIFVMVAVWIPMAISVYKGWDDVVTTMKNVSHLAALAEAVLDSILCKFNRCRLQVTKSFINNNIFLVYANNS